MGCTDKDYSERAISDIEAAEATFAQMALDSGVPTAFLHFAAKETVLMRGPQFIEGREAILDYFTKSTLDSVVLQWKPDKDFAAKSGDIGYTYGKYQFSAVDTAGNPLKSDGYFHTVWKKKPDGC